MHKLNNRINLDRANSAADNASKEGATMRNSSKKTPRHLRFAPGAILRQIGLAVLAVVAIILLNDVSAADALKESHYYEKFGGERAMCQPPMDCKITATPTIKSASHASYSKSTVNGYVDSSYPILNNKRERQDPGYMWTEYFKIHWDEIVENPDHDPDDPCSHKYMGPMITLTTKDSTSMEMNT